MSLTMSIMLGRWRGESHTKGPVGNKWPRAGAGFPQPLQLVLWDRAGPNRLLPGRSVLNTRRVLRTIPGALLSLHTCSPREHAAQQHSQAQTLSAPGPSRTGVGGRWRARERVCEGQDERYFVSACLFEKYCRCVCW